MHLDNHPCFNDKIRHTAGRIHLPVAPRCNIQCRFCNRKFDCVNESRPGVASGILSPSQAIFYLKEALIRKPDIAVVGIAGPGDPFANAKQTMETLEKVREACPEMLLCVATNGLNIHPYIDDLARLRLSHATVTVNAVDPEVGEKIYAYVRHDKRVFQAKKGAQILLENQLHAIEKLKKKGMIVKINTIIIPGINEEHIEEVAGKMSGYNVNIMNCIPYYKNEGSAFEDKEEPSGETVRKIRKRVSRYLPQMHHCTRCRADAAGFLSDKPDNELMSLLQTCEKMPVENNLSGVRENGDRSHIAVASMEGVLINQHLGDARQFLIYGKKNGRISLVDTRKAPEKGLGDERWKRLSRILNDCRLILVSGAGEKPRKILSENGIEIVLMEGLIDEVTHSLFEGKSCRHLVKREKKACAGTGTGCM